MGRRESVNHTDQVTELLHFLMALSVFRALKEIVNTIIFHL